MNKSKIIKLADNHCDLGEQTVYREYTGAPPPQLPAGTSAAHGEGLYSLRNTDNSTVWFVPHPSWSGAAAWWNTLGTDILPKWDPDNPSGVIPKFNDWTRLNEELQNKRREITDCADNDLCGRARESDLRREERTLLQQVQAKGNELQQIGPDVGLSEDIAHLTTGRDSGVFGDGLDCWIANLTEKRQAWLSTIELEEQSRPPPQSAYVGGPPSDDDSGYYDRINKRERRIPQLVTVPLGRTVVIHGLERNETIRVGDLTLDLANNDFINSQIASGGGTIMVSLREAAAIAGTPEGKLLWDPSNEIGGGFVQWNPTRTSGIDAMTDRAEAGIILIYNMMKGSVTENDLFPDLNMNDHRIRWGSEGVLNEIFNFVVGSHMDRDCGDNAEFRPARRGGRRTFGWKNRLKACEVRVARDIFNVYKKYGGATQYLTEDGRLSRWAEGMPPEDYPEDVYRNLLVGQSDAIEAFNSNLPSWYNRGGAGNRADDGLISNNSKKRNIYKKIIKNRDSRNTLLMSLNKSIRIGKLRDLSKKT